MGFKMLRRVFTGAVGCWHRPGLAEKVVDDLQGMTTSSSMTVADHDDRFEWI